jgi:hypothetical protein
MISFIGNILWNKYYKNVLRREIFGSLHCITGSNPTYNTFAFSNYSVQTGKLISGARMVFAINIVI